MKLLISIVLSILFIVSEIYSQDYSPNPIIDVETETGGIYPETNQMLRGGIEKTASGTLRVLIIFVRYKDDLENTPTWPDYNVLPVWAQTFVDPAIPSNNIFTSLNLSDFFDRSSGGDGNGILGSFKVIGDVVYVTTLQNQNQYSNDAQVFTEILQTLDNPLGNYNIDFSLYDNWEFMKNNVKYLHEYKPNVGDGKADHIFIINRQGSRPYGLWAEKTLSSVNFLSNEQVEISRFCGSRLFGAKNAITPSAVGGPAHEYCHYLFGGDQETGHFDGYNYQASQTGNRGRINKFALMIASSAGGLSAYERYRLGWLNPYVVTGNIDYVLKDTHLKNEAIIIPIGEPYKGSWKEFYLIENYHTRRAYSGANPFLVDELFGETFSNGLLVFHIEDQNDTLPCATKINILCADGKWTWKLLQGASTPADRSDDLFGRDLPTRFGNFDERHFITINVGGIVYNDYICLNNHPSYPGSKYNRNDFLGDYNDFFRMGYNQVFTRYSNPGAYLINGTPKNVGFEILSYNPATKEYTLSLQTDYTAILSLSPSKPQNLQVSRSTNNHPLLTWEANIEPDLVHYRIYKYISYDLGWQYLATSRTNSYEDPTENYCPIGQYCQSGHDVHYKVTARDNQAKESVPSDSVKTHVLGGAPDKIVAEQMQQLPTEYKLEQNYPNPFNPTTVINYQLPKAGYVQLKIYDLLGAEVATLVDEVKTEGHYTMSFNAGNLTSGVYIYSLRVNDFIQNQKMTLIK